MKTKFNVIFRALTLAGLLASGAQTLAAQGGQEQTQKPSLDKDKQKPADSTNLVLDTGAAPKVNPEEDASFKAYQAAPASDIAKKLQLGEEFIAKYPLSRYLSSVYSQQVYGYFVVGQVQKLTEIGEKELALNPNDVNVLAMMSQVMSRSYDPKGPNAAQILDKVEQYGKRAIDVMTTMAKPEGASDEQFAAAKSQVLSMSHSALGVACVRRGRYADAIPELEQSLKVVTDPDPVNYFLLGYANEKTAHFDDAAAAFTKCAAIPGSMQATCKTGIEEAKKLAATQLSAPK